MSFMQLTTPRQPESPNHFERLMVKLWTKLLDDPNVKIYGRSGQKQQGCDLWGKRNQDKNHVVIVQCKLKKKGNVTKAEINTEIAKARKFKPNIKELIIVSTGEIDSKLDEHCRLAEQNENFEVHFFGWSAIVDYINQYNDVKEFFDPDDSARMKHVSTQLNNIQATTSLIHDSTSRMVHSHTYSLIDNSEQAEVVENLEGLLNDIIKCAESGNRPSLDLALKSQHTYIKKLSKKKRYSILMRLGYAALTNGRQSACSDLFKQSKLLKTGPGDELNSQMLIDLLDHNLKSVVSLFLENSEADFIDHRHITHALMAAAKGNTKSLDLQSIDALGISTKHTTVARVEYLRSRDLPWHEEAEKVFVQHSDYNEAKLIYAESLLDQIGSYRKHDKNRRLTSRLSAHAHKAMDIYKPLIEEKEFLDVDDMTNLANYAMTLHCCGEREILLKLLAAVRDRTDLPDHPRILLAAIAFEHDKALFDHLQQGIPDGTAIDALRLNFAFNCGDWQQVRNYASCVDSIEMSDQPLFRFGIALAEIQLSDLSMENKVKSIIALNSEPEADLRALCAQASTIAVLTDTDSAQSTIEKIEKQEWANLLTSEISMLFATLFRCNRWQSILKLASLIDSADIGETEIFYIFSAITSLPPDSRNGELIRRHALHHPNSKTLQHLLAVTELNDRNVSTARQMFLIRWQQDRQAADLLGYFQSVNIAGCEDVNLEDFDSEQIGGHPYDLVRVAYALAPHDRGKATDLLVRVVSENNLSLDKSLSILFSETAMMMLKFYPHEKTIIDEDIGMTFVDRERNLHRSVYFTNDKIPPIGTVLSPASNLFISVQGLGKGEEFSTTNNHGSHRWEITGVLDFVAFTLLNLLEQVELRFSDGFPYEVTFT